MCSLRNKSENKMPNKCAHFVYRAKLKKKKMHVDMEVVLICFFIDGFELGF